MKILNLVLWCSILQVQQSAHCGDRDPKKPSKSEIDSIAKTRSRRELARANQRLTEQLREQLIARQASSTTPPGFLDLEAGLGTPAPAGAGTGLGATPTTTKSTPRMRGRSASTEELMVVTLGAQVNHAEQKLRYQREQDRYNRQTRTIAALIGVGNCLLTAGFFIVQNWDKIKEKLA